MAIQGGIDGDYDDRMTVVYLVILDDSAPKKDASKCFQDVKAMIFSPQLLQVSSFSICFGMLYPWGMKPTKEATGYFIGCSWGLLLV